MDDAAVRRSLLRWYRRAARDLPWRRSRDPYAIWVSEVMLQQTRIDVATPYYLRWMARFPTVQALAAADPEDVLRLWSGLGYYARARKLQDAAKIVADGGMPDTLEGLLELPGIGPYTAGAIASIAFDRREAAVDGNVVRVLSRLNAWPGSSSSPTLLTKVQAAAARLVPAASPGEWNQALMDLGATVCVPKSPKCGTCPLESHCQARRLGREEAIPGSKRKAVVRGEERGYAVVRDRDRVLLVRNPSKGLLAGLWSLPGGPAGRPLADVVLEQAGARIRLHGKPSTARHLFSHRAWTMTVDVADLLEDGARPAARETAWVAVDKLAGHALPSAMRVALAAAGVGKAKSRRGSGRP